MSGPAAEPQPEQNGDTAPSRIVLTFAGRGLADLEITLEGVSPGQIMAAAWWLDTWARSQLTPQQGALRGGLVIPGGGLPAVLPHQRART